MHSISGEDKATNTVEINELVCFGMRFKHTDRQIERSIDTHQVLVMKCLRETANEHSNEKLVKPIFSILYIEL